jgi:hypothetical protein
MEKQYRVTGERIKKRDDTFAEVGQIVTGADLATDQPSVDYLVGIGKIEPSDGNPLEDPEVVKLRQETDTQKERIAALEEENASLKRDANDLRGKIADQVTTKAVNDLERENADLKEENVRLRGELEAAQRDDDGEPPVLTENPNSGEPPKPQPAKPDPKGKPNTGISGTADNK